MGLKYIQNDIKDKYLVLLHSIKNNRDSSLHYNISFLYRGFPGFPHGLPEALVKCCIYEFNVYYLYGNVPLILPNIY